MIRFIDVYKEYDNGTKALKGINLRIDDGEFVFLVGPSGSGKSTIIKLITGEIGLTEGKLMVNGYSLNNISPRQVPLMRRTLGIIFQDFRLIDKKTVYENLSFAMRAIGASPRDVKRRIPYVLQLVGLEHKADRYPGQLSGGEQQRVAIARALVNNPNMIIADEPTGNLDPHRSLEIMMLLERINDLGTTVLVVTHEKSLVNRFTKRVVAIEDGRIINDETGGYYNGEKVWFSVLLQRGLPLHLHPRLYVLCRRVHDCGLPSDYGLLFPGGGELEPHAGGPGGRQSVFGLCGRELHRGGGPGPPESD